MPARPLNSFSVGGQAFTTHSKADDRDVHSDPEPYAGDNALYCHLGKHAYINSKCRYCDRRVPKTITPVIVSDYQNKVG